MQEQIYLPNSCTGRNFVVLLIHVHNRRKLTYSLCPVWVSIWLSFLALFNWNVSSVDWSYFSFHQFTGGAHIMFESAVTHSDFFYHIFWSRREMGEEIFFKLSAFNNGATQKFFFYDKLNVHKERHSHDNSLKLITSSANCARLSLKA